MLITLKPSLARLAISPREERDDEKTDRYLEEEIKIGKWDNIPPIWITPNFLFNGLFAGFKGGEFHPTLKPFILYNGHHRLNKALEYNLPIRAYIRYTLGNPEMPEEEKLQEDIPY